MGKVIGYARTSTVEQLAGLNDQIAELTANGAERIFSEQVSGTGGKRPELQRALEYVRDGDGDVFVVTKPDRLARSTADLLRILNELESKGATVRILSMGVDTGTPTGRLLVTMLGAVAEFERAIMLERQRCGIAAAVAAGRYKGRAPTARRKAPEVRRLKGEGRSVPEIMAATGVSRAAVYRALAEGKSAA